MGVPIVTHPPLFTVTFSLFVVEFQWRVSVAREEQMLYIDRVKDRVTGQIDFQSIGSIAIVGEMLVAWVDVVA